MSLIEQAAERLEQLKKAGVVLPAAPAAAESAAGAAPEATPAAGAPSAETSVRRARRTGRGESRRVTIDLGRLAAAGFVTSDAERSQIAEEFRVIKRPILQNVRGKTAGPVDHANLVMVTSALPGEGKTFTALNLALSLATELDHTVLLVDADVARPAILDVLGLPNAKGLLDVLTDRSLGLPDVLLRTNIDKLSILPAGTAHRKATELLASEAMAGLVAEMAERYSDRIIVFDSPPLLPTTEARVLATHMGQVIVVVEADRTTQNAVKQALATVESCPIVMMVLNRAARSDVGTYYAGAYGAYGRYGAQA